MNECKYDRVNVHGFDKEHAPKERGRVRSTGYYETWGTFLLVYSRQ